MRLTSNIFVSVLIRRLFADGLVATIEKKGSKHSGAIFIRVLNRDNKQMLLCPAPQSFFQTKGEDRMFEIRMENASEADVNIQLIREKSFDEDIWIVEIETEHPERYLDLTAPQAGI